MSTNQESEYPGLGTKRSAPKTGNVCANPAINPAKMLNATFWLDQFHCGDAAEISGRDASRFRGHDCDQSSLFSTAGLSVESSNWGRRKHRPNMCRGSSRFLNTVGAC